MARKYLLFTSGVLLGAMVTISFVSRVKNGERSLDALASRVMTRGLQIWNSFSDTNIKEMVQDGLRVLEPASSDGYTLLTSKKMVAVPHTADGDVFQGEIVQLESPQQQEEVSKHISFASTKPGMVVPPHAARQRSKRVQAKAANNQETWTPGTPGQFSKSVVHPNLVKKTQRPETKLGKEKYEPELGVKAIGAGISERPDAIRRSAGGRGANASDVIFLNKPPPLVPYHEQYKFLHELYVPSLSSVSALRQIMSTNPTSSVLGESLLSKALPDMANQKGIFEHENLKLHLCNAVFEAYSASYLTTKQHMISVKSESFNLSWVNCEMASFIHMRDSKAFYKNPHGSGMIMQSLDVLDFSVIHLSAFERSNRKYRTALWKNKNEQKTTWAKIDEVVQTASTLEALISPRKTLRNITYSNEAKKTVVIMPFLGGAMGAGHSELGNRFEYLKACFWSFFEFVPNIVAGVTRQGDVEWAWKRSGLPFYDVINMPPLPKSAGLPVGLTQQVKARLVDGRYSFDYIFFTESDQILISRQLQLMFHQLQQYPHRMLLPHRLMPYSRRAISEIHKKRVETIGTSTWMQQSCCLPRQNCQERKTWKPLAHESVPVINYYGLYVPLGNVNFLDESFRACKLTPYINDYCP